LLSVGSTETGILSEWVLRQATASIAMADPTVRNSSSLIKQSLLVEQAVICTGMAIQNK
jgi:hypothetical protein